jgi:hypothetical protein
MDAFKIINRKGVASVMEAFVTFLTVIEADPAAATAETCHAPPLLEP